MEIELTFLNEEDIKYDAFEKYYFSLAEVIFKHLNIDGILMFEVDLVSKEKIQQINKDYRHKDMPTDVISFAFEDDEDFSLLKGDLPRDLGEIIICVDKAIEQAQEYNHSFIREMSFLFTHGLLHLLGYDHMCEEDEKEMFLIQDQIMEKMGL